MSGFDVRKRSSVLALSLSDQGYLWVLISIVTGRSQSQVLCITTSRASDI